MHMMVLYQTPLAVALIPEPAQKQKAGGNAVDEKQQRSGQVLCLSSQMQLESIAEGPALFCPVFSPVYVSL